MTTTKAHVVIYSRPGCHLCDQAKQAMDDANCASDYILDIVNIESDPKLLNRYANDIPVITINGAEAFKHRVDSKLFKAAIAKMRSAKKDDP